jgi:hypothetical protein
VPFRPGVPGLSRRAAIQPALSYPETAMTPPGTGPHSDGDTYDLISDALAKLARRRGAWAGDDLTAITLLASLIDQAERFLPDLVDSARSNEHTWDQIARALATSPEQAHLRYDPESPIADTRWPHNP